MRRIWREFLRFMLGLLIVGSMFVVFVATCMLIEWLPLHAVAIISAAVLAVMIKNWR